MKSLLLSILLVFLTSTNQAKANNGALKKMRLLPIHGLTMVESKGKTILVSTNSRFMITNFTLYDMLNKQEIKNLRDAQSIDKVYLDKINLNFNDLGSIEYGTGSSEVTLFVDPLCPYCKKMLKTVKSLSSDYHFHIVITPLLGQRSMMITRQLLCHKNEAEKFEYIYSENYQSLAPPASKCSTDKVKKILITSNIMGFQAVPFIIAPNGNTHTGMPKNGLQNWLKEQEQ